MVTEYIGNYKRQLRIGGFCYDWDREINSSAPEYYRWTQWFFLLLYKRGLAYRTEAPVNWCPKEGLVLANEEAVDGKCWRCGTPWSRSSWCSGSSASLPTPIAWPTTSTPSTGRTRSSSMQRNWIGRSEGAEFDMADQGSRRRQAMRVFTTPPGYGLRHDVLHPGA